MFMKANKHLFFKSQEGSIISQPPPPSVQREGGGGGVGRGGEGEGDGGCRVTFVEETGKNFVCTN